MRALFSTLTMGFLAACSPSIPDSAAGVGFDNSSDAQLAREAALNTGQPLALPTVISDETLSGGVTTAGTANAGIETAIPTVIPQPSAGAGSGADIAAQTAAALATSAPGPAPLETVASGFSAAGTSTGTASGTATSTGTGTTSGQDDLAALSNSQTSTSGADANATERTQFVVVAPPAPRNVIEYAQTTDNPLGNRIYSRSGFNSATKAARNCAKYATPEQAQSAFLTKGGPQKDRQGLDPDGDGYACTWNPVLFRQATSN